MLVRQIHGFISQEEEDVSTSKTGVTESTEESLATPNDPPRPRVRRPKKDRAYKPKAPDLVQDADVRHLFTF